MSEVFHCQVRIGEHNLATTGETKLPEKTLSVARSLRHEGFNKTEAINDLALLELSEEVDISVYTPVCLPPPHSNNYFGHRAWVYGNYNQQARFTRQCAERHSGSLPISTWKGFIKSLE